MLHHHSVQSPTTGRNRIAYVEQTCRRQYLAGLCLNVLVGYSKLRYVHISPLVLIVGLLFIYLNVFYLNFILVIF